ncbi:ABC transporter permease [Paenibacillus odorifer]|nr:ABC transporter permease [Paenibacillus odorifer]
MKQEKFHELSNELYTNHYAALFSNGDNKWLENPSTKLNYRVFVEYNDTFRLLLINNGKWSPPMISGQFFLDKDKENGAVIGKEMISYIKEDNKGNKYIDFQGENYQVKGVMGASFASPTDYLVLLHKPHPLPILPGSKIIVDSNNKSTVLSIVSNITKSDSSVMVIESSQKGVARTTNIPFIYRLLIYQFYFLLFISVISLVRYWYEKEKRVTSVLFILGISKRRINKLIFTRLLINFLISGVISIILLLAYDPQSLFLLKEMIFVILTFISISWILISIILVSDYLYSKRGASGR